MCGMCADVLQGLLVDTVRVKINYTYTDTLSYTNGIATISSEYKTIYNLVLGEISGDYLLSCLVFFPLKTGQCDMEWELS